MALNLHLDTFLFLHLWSGVYYIAKKDSGRLRISWQPWLLKPIICARPEFWMSVKVKLFRFRVPCCAVPQFFFLSATKNLIELLYHIKVRAQSNFLVAERKKNRSTARQCTLKGNNFTFTFILNRSFWKLSSNLHRLKRRPFLSFFCFWIVGMKLR